MGRLGQNAGRNEHEVYLDSVSGRVLKLTKENAFGARKGFARYLERLGREQSALGG